MTVLGRALFGSLVTRWLFIYHSFTAAGEIRSSQLIRP